MTGERHCEICGSRSQTHLYDVNGLPIVRCRDCRLVFVARSPEPEELIALYDEAYYEDCNQPGYGGYQAAEQRKRHHYRTLLRQLEKQVAPGALLEVGCAYGYFLDEARHQGWEVRGVEPSLHAAEYVRAHLGIEVSTRSLTDLPVEPDSQDAIAMWDVIEHLPNPRETLVRAHEWLRPAGVLAISTGDIDSLTARLHGRDWSLMAPPWHQFYFSRRTLRRLLTATSFQVEAVRGDGSIAFDASSMRPRIPAALATLLRHPWATAAARRIGGGSIIFVFARKVGV